MNHPKGLTLFDYLVVAPQSLVDSATFTVVYFSPSPSLLLLSSFKHDVNLSLSCFHLYGSSVQCEYENDARIQIVYCRCQRMGLRMNQLNKSSKSFFYSSTSSWRLQWRIDKIKSEEESPSLSPPLLVSVGVWCFIRCLFTGSCFVDKDSSADVIWTTARLRRRCCCCCCTPPAVCSLHFFIRDERWLELLLTVTFFFFLFLHFYNRVENSFWLRLQWRGEWRVCSPFGCSHRSKFLLLML